MSFLTLKRCHEVDQTTFGVLIHKDHPICVTLEPSWEKNAHDISCIPSGKYEIRKRTSGKFGEHLILIGVPERSEILIHRGNSREDTHGCILVGKSFDKQGNQSIISGSSIAMQYLLILMTTALDDYFDITIEDSEWIF